MAPLKVKKPQKATLSKALVAIETEGSFAIPLMGMNMRQKRKGEITMNLHSAEARARPTDLLLSMPAALWR